MATGSLSTSSKATPQTDSGPKDISSDRSVTMIADTHGLEARNQTTARIAAPKWMEVTIMDKTTIKLVVAMCMSVAGLLLSVISLCIKLL